MGLGRRVYTDRPRLLVKPNYLRNNKILQYDCGEVLNTGGKHMKQDKPIDWLRKIFNQYKIHWQIIVGGDDACTITVIGNIPKLQLIVSSKDSYKGFDILFNERYRYCLYYINSFEYSKITINGKDFWNKTKGDWNVLDGPTVSNLLRSMTIQNSVTFKFLTPLSGCHFRFIPDLQVFCKILNINPQVLEFVSQNMKKNEITNENLIYEVTSYCISLLKTLEMDRQPFHKDAIYWSSFEGTDRRGNCVPKLICWDNGQIEYVTTLPYLDENYTLRFYLNNHEWYNALAEKKQEVASKMAPRVIVPLQEGGAEEENDSPPRY